MLIKDAIALFRQGKALTNGAIWKQSAAAGSALAAFLIAGVGVARGLGYDLPIDDATATKIAEGAVALVGAVNAVVHCIANTDAGLPAKPVADGSSGSANDDLYRG